MGDGPAFAPASRRSFSMSALHPKATICCVAAKWRYMPIPTKVHRNIWPQSKAPHLGQLLGARGLADGGHREQGAQVRKEVFPLPRVW